MSVTWTGKAVELGGSGTVQFHAGWLWCSLMYRQASLQLAFFVFGMGTMRKTWSSLMSDNLEYTLVKPYLASSVL